MWARRCVSVLAVAAMILSAAPALAETFFDIYGGGSFTENAKTNLSVPGIRGTGLTEWDPTGIVGARVGLWFHNLPWLGVAVDGSWFRPEEDAANNPAKIDVVPISALVMARLPLLRSPGFPQGQLQPYVGVGVGAFYTQLKFDTTLGRRFSDHSWDVGADLRGGLTFMFTRSIGLFSEYRYTYVEPSWHRNIAGVDTNVDMRLKTHHVLAGLTFRF